MMSSLFLHWLEILEKVINIMSKKFLMIFGPDRTEKDEEDEEEE